MTFYSNLTFAPKTNTTETYQTFNAQTSEILIYVIRNNTWLIIFIFRNPILFSVSSQISLKQKTFTNHMNVLLKNLCRFLILNSSITFHSTVNCIKNRQEFALVL